MATTEDGLAVVTETTFLEFLQDYDITSPDNDPALTERIKSENPEVYRILQLGMQGAPSKEARAYYEMGMQIAYDLLRRQTGHDSPQ